jgi:hypothetical protein
VIALALVASPAPPPRGQASPGTVIRAEFRVFDGTTEVTPFTRLRIRPSGSTETGRIVDGGDLTLDLAPGIYDAQAVRQDNGQVVNVRWAERLVIMPYPDEGGRHLEVINFTDGYGALELKWPEGEAPDPAGVAVTLSNAGESRPIPTRLLHGLGYLLAVVPAGAYDVHVMQPGKRDTTMANVDVPADRTRMKLIQ